MEEISASIDVIGLESLDQDLKDFKNFVVLALAQKATPAVQSSMFDTLKKHIDKDVYEAYDPKEYERRRGGPNALDDLSNGDILSLLGPVGGAMPTGDFQIAAGITYDPRGTHQNPKWSSNDDPNEIIGRIETKSPPYKYGKGVPKRPFWQRTVQELIEGGELGKTFIQAMNEAGLEIEMGYDEVERESNDGDY